MMRTDRRGRALKTFLGAEIVGSEITVEQMREALGISKSRWYESNRPEAEDFPDPNELLHLANHYGLGEDGWLNLLVEFDWLTARSDAPGYTNMPNHPSGPLPAIREEEGKSWRHRGPAV